MIKVYISGPITLGVPEHNFFQADRMFGELVQHGYAPYNPMLTMKSMHAETIPWHKWIELCCEWVPACDAVLRLPGVSRGAEVECLLAQQHGLPVFHDIETLNRWASSTSIGRSLHEDRIGTDLQSLIDAVSVADTHVAQGQLTP